MIDLKPLIRDIKHIQKELNLSKDPALSFLWFTVLKNKLHSLDSFLDSQIAVYEKATMVDKFEK